ncbi:MAG TPA: BatA domain-containing protein [Gemmataceae bacterium]|nr:BatA domain-containing protein [Gemmataceae bacterium]
MITFLSPLFLVGLLAAAIPLVIHLSRSRRTKKMRFSTTRFFTDQFLRSYRMSRLKELLLLVFRMALCALLAAALARPLLLSQGQAPFLGGSRSIVLVIDNSASMGYMENGVTMLDRSRSVARELVEGLAENDTASIVLAGRRASGPDVLFPEPTAERGDVLRAIDAVQVLPLGTDLTRAVAEAQQIAQKSNAKSKEVYVLSDLQDSGWELTDSANQTAESSETLFFFVRVRPKTISNLAVTAVQYGATRPMIGVPFAIRPHIVSQGEVPPTCVASLYIDGKKVGERRLERLEDGRWAVPRFYHTFTTGGWHSGYVQVREDGFTHGSRRYFALEMLDAIRVLAVNGAPSQVPRLDELFFLKTALTAGGPDAKNAITVDVTSPTALASADLAKYPLVILANVESLPDAAVEKLETFADKGGSLLFFLGDKVNPAFYNDRLTGPTRLHGGLLPGRLLQVEANPAGAESFAFVSHVNYDHTALAAFQEDRSANLAGVTFKAFWGVDPGASAVLMRASTGAPLLCEKSFGKGRVMLFASTCDRDWTTFPVRPVYLPWVYRVVSYLAQEPLGPRAFFATGDHVPLPVAATEGIGQGSVRKPDGTLGYPTMTTDPEQPLVFTDTTQPGIYSLVAPNKQETAALFAVNLDRYESDLTYLDDVFAEGEEGHGRQAKIEAAFKKLLPGHSAEMVYYVDDPGRTAEMALSARRGFKLWDIILVIVLAIALFEPWLANRISLRHYARPQQLLTHGARRVSEGVPPALAGASG